MTSTITAITIIITIVVIVVIIIIITTITITQGEEQTEGESKFNPGEAEMICRFVQDYAANIQTRTLNTEVENLLNLTYK